MNQIIKKGTRIFIVHMNKQKEIDSVKWSDSIYSFHISLEFVFFKRNLEFVFHIKDHTRNNTTTKNQLKNSNKNSTKTRCNSQRQEEARRRTSDPIDFGLTRSTDSFLICSRTSAAAVAVAVAIFFRTHARRPGRRPLLGITPRRRSR